MGLQDEMAVVAAGRALAAAGLAAAELGERAGLYLAAGYIPFERADLEALLDASTETGTLSMRRFSTEGIHAINPLLAFRCLPNMPAFHVSVNFDIQGPYFTTYPGIGQFYLALEEATRALRCGTIEVALVMGVAHQKNFLVMHHFSRIADPIPESRLADGAGCIVLETEARAEERGATLRARLTACDVEYEPMNPFLGQPTQTERFYLDGALRAPLQEHGAASLLSVMAVQIQPEVRCLRHLASTRDGFSVSSTWLLDHATL